MSNTRTHTWQDIHERIRGNILNRTWSPGELIPGEAELAEKFGCARTTVNRAMRELATAGVIDRKRRAGTRVTVQRTRRVTAEIPIIRTQVEAQGLEYSFCVQTKKLLVPNTTITQIMRLRAQQKALHIQSLHLANGVPFIHEDRWINTHTIPEVLKVDFNQTSVNEWLVENVPLTKGEFVIEAVASSKRVAAALEISCGDSILSSERATWLDDRSVTLVTLYYAPGHQMVFTI
ncbi:MAG: GntR family transcriptional regulator [Granulosicoccaceae bacterium]